LTEAKTARDNSLASDRQPNNNAPLSDSQKAALDKKVEVATEKRDEALAKKNDTFGKFELSLKQFEQSTRPVKIIGQVLENLMTGIKNSYSAIIEIKQGQLAFEKEKINARMKLEETFLRTLDEEAQNLDTYANGIIDLIRSLSQTVHKPLQG